MSKILVGVDVGTSGAKCIIADECNTIRDCDIDKIRTIFKSVSADLRNALRYCHIYQIGAIVKHPMTDDLYVPRNQNIAQTMTFCKSQIPNINNTLWDMNTP